MSSNAFSGYALLGSGRLARHLQHYLQQLQLPFATWSRNRDPQFNSAASLEQAVDSASHVLLAVSDGAIAELARPWLGSGKKLVHFSGACRVPGLVSAHPLMTFGADVQDLAWYKSIPFIIESAWPLPGWPNRHFTLAPESAPLYHALCSLAANSSYLMWREIGAIFERDFGLPRAVLLPLLHQTVDNAGRAQADSFTGPVARGDWRTVAAHQAALAIEPGLEQVYKGYLELAERSGYRQAEAHEHS